MKPDLDKIRVEIQRLTQELTLWCVPTDDVWTERCHVEANCGIGEQINYLVVDKAVASGNDGVGYTVNIRIAGLYDRNGLNMGECVTLSVSGSQELKQFTKYLRNALRVIERDNTHLTDGPVKA